MNDRLRLMIPGPTQVSEKVRARLALPMQPHYGDEWSKLYFEVVNKVKRVFQTANDLFILAATSSATMEMGVSQFTFTRSVSRTTAARHRRVASAPNVFQGSESTSILDTTSGGGSVAS